MAMNNKTKRTLVLVPFIAAISWRKRYPRVAHVLDKGADGTAQTPENVNVLARPDSDLATDGFFTKQNTTCPKRKATMKPNKRQLASWVLTTLCEMIVKSCDMHARAMTFHR